MRTAGLVDLQVNGFAGVDFNAGPGLTASALDHALEAMLATGVTLCLPTVITATAAELEARLGALDAAVSASRLGPAMCPGYHLEGPFLNPGAGYSGCHPAAAMTLPDWAVVQRLQLRLGRPILLVTVAPERAGGPEFVRAATAAGVLVAIGHSAAALADVAAAADAGATLSTHLGNGLPQTLPKLNNPLMAQLAEDRLAPTLIADGIHVPPHALKVMVRAKGAGRCILVTDAVAGAAAAPGRYDFAGMAIERGADGSVRIPGAGTLAGSALCLDQAVRNVVAWGIAPAAAAAGMAADNPMAALRPALAAHGLDCDPGAVEWSESLRVRSVHAHGSVRTF